MYQEYLRNNKSTESGLIINLLSQLVRIFNILLKEVTFLNIFNVCALWSIKDNLVYMILSLWYHILTYSKFRKLHLI